MSKETKEITGDIQNIRKDFKAIQIQNIWYNSFTILDDFEKGDCVKVQYSENNKDGKVFLNIKNIEMVEAKREESKQEITKLTPQISDTTIKRPVSDTTINCLIMQSIQYSKDKNIKLEIATKEIIDCYKKIIGSI